MNALGAIAGVLVGLACGFVAGSAARRSARRRAWYAASVVVSFLAAAAFVLGSQSLAQQWLGLAGIGVLGGALAGIRYGFDRPYRMPAAKVEVAVEQADAVDPPLDAAEQEL